MSSAATTMVLPPEQAEAFTALVLRYLDGSCTADEVRDLQVQLAACAAHRDVFVRTCHLAGCLHESYGPKRSEWQAKIAGAAARPDTVHDSSPEDTVHPLPKSPKDPS